VQEGDTLIPIANKFGISVADLLAANAGLDAARLQIGQRLIIPAAGAAAVNPQQPNQLLPSPTPNPFTIRGVNVYRTAAGSLECLGEVINPGPNALSNVQLQINLQDNSDKVLLSQMFFVAQDVVQAGQTSPFRVLFTDPPASFSKFSVRALRGEVSDPTTRFVKMSVTKKEGKTEEGSKFHVTGEVTNNDKQSAKSVRVIVTTYDTDKRVIGFRNVTINTSDLESGGALPFDITLLSASAPADFNVSVEGLK
jgi:LysM repeat protein